MLKAEQTKTLTKVFETFGNYILLKRLAAGGMAEVFLARPASQGGNGRVQVVKRILPHVANNPLFVKMFQTEIQVIMGFNHPHTVQLHDFGEINHQPYIAMEYIEGKNLREVTQKLIEKKELMPVPTALSLVAQAAAGLAYAHTFVNKVTGDEVNAIHRDISPHNLILSYDGNVKVIDFGIAKAASGVPEQTRVGTIKGKTAYLSPEQINSKPLDGRSDIFSLGIVAWELLTLRRPFSREGDTDVTVINRIDNCDQHLVPPSTYNSHIPPEIDEVIMKALQKDPANRYANASEFQAALRQVMLRFYPKYSYSDTGKLVHSLFEKEIAKERAELRELNHQAQKALSESSDAGTMILEHQTPGMVTGVFNNIRAIAPPNVEDRLMSIEAMMKQKASGRHYLMLAFYIISIIVLKLDDKYSVFNLLTGGSQPQVEAMATNPVQANSNGKHSGASKGSGQQRHLSSQSQSPSRNQTIAQQAKQKKLSYAQPNKKRQ